ncbi:hypothetical protein Ahy_A10g050464 [Arachis hypogaea]|uniref:RNase H type-1 domain-containing protein n=1 Tax=Arachis hypogaea TaxID=3818 RepID=A0A445B9E8_ARAHY|nr:hypothetical protein Ahy_A10g050464 [Arachis hypogaea]
MVPDLVCQICLKGLETVEHALLLCDWARATWVWGRMPMDPNNGDNGGIKRRTVLEFLGKIHAKSSNVAEAQAIRQALIIQLNPRPGEALAIIQDIQILIENLPEKRMTWTPRKGNRLAHAVAKAAESKTLRSTWSTQPPAEIRSILRSEIQT